MQSGLLSLTVDYCEFYPTEKIGLLHPIPAKLCACSHGISYQIDLWSEHASSVRKVIFGIWIRRDGFGRGKRVKNITRFCPHWYISPNYRAQFFMSYDQLQIVL